MYDVFNCHFFGVIISVVFREKIVALCSCQNARHCPIESSEFYRENQVVAKVSVTLIVWSVLVLRLHLLILYAFTLALRCNWPERTQQIVNYRNIECAMHMQCSLSFLSFSIVSVGDAVHCNVQAIIANVWDANEWVKASEWTNVAKVFSIDFIISNAWFAIGFCANVCASAFVWLLVWFWIAIKLDEVKLGHRTSPIYTILMAWTQCFFQFACLLCVGSCVTHIHYTQHI